MSPRQPIKSSDLDKSRIKHGGLLNKHFCIKKNQISPKTWQKLSISTFPIIRLWNSNQSSYLTEIKNITFVKGYVLSKYTKFRLHPPYGSEKIFTKIDPFCRPDNQSNTQIWTKVV